MERIRVLNPPPRQAALQRIQQRFSDRFPTPGATSFIKTWAGIIDTMPDVVPVLDEVDSVPGCIVATGFSGHGFGMDRRLAKSWLIWCRAKSLSMICIGFASPAFQMDPPLN